MLNSIQVLDVELSRPLPTLVELTGYGAVQALVRLHGTPIGYVRAPIEQGCCFAQTLSRLILEQHHESIARQLLRNGLAAGQLPQNLNLEALLELPPPTRSDWPLVTVAVCSRDRAADLAICLAGLTQLDYPNLEILVIDNAPTSDATAQLVEQYSAVRYVCEPRLGLDWARNRAILEAKGDIIAYTDDDGVVDRHWVKSIATVFADNPDVMAVTGLVVPYELETDAQILFEQYGGFSYGFEQRWYRGSKQMSWPLLRTGQYGRGVNMAYRRSLFDTIGGFDPALDVGTATHSGGDLEMFCRVLREDYTLVYEPQAIVRHRHCRTYALLRTQIANQGSLAYCAPAAWASAGQGQGFWWMGLVGMGYWNIRRLLRSLVHPTFLPRDLIWAELWSSFVSLTRYPIARRQAEAIATAHVDQPMLPHRPTTATALTKPTKAMAVRAIELSQPLTPLSDLSDYQAVQLFFTWQHSPIAQVTLPARPAITLTQLRTAIVDLLGLRLFDLDQHYSDVTLAARTLATLTQRYSIPAATQTLPVDVPISIVIGTCNRPNDLRRCLQSLTQQQSPRSIEIIVVDNRPASNLTPPVVTEFPNVVLLNEARAGVAYARNAGITQSHGEIIITVDDDVVAPPDWLEKLLVPFVRADVLAVTGNVLPLELDTEAQCLFEQYGNGGLGRGFKRIEADSTWFMRSSAFAVPTWELGATANSAFRASVFHNRDIGLMNETLGPGMPSGVGEDIYLFYKILKAGGTIIYEPKAYVWHQHRRDRAALCHQLYGYSKGIVSYHLTTLFNDGDLRAIFTLLVGLPLYYSKRLVYWLLGQRSYPLSLMLLSEIRGNLVGPWALWKSHQRVRQQGRSALYVPLNQRHPSSVTPEPLFSSR